MNISNNQSTAPGSFDNSFGTQGVVRIQLPSGPFQGTSRLLPDGKILSISVTEQLDTLAIVKHTPEGVLDTTFGSGGVVYTRLPINDYLTLLNFLVLENGKIVVVGGLGDGFSYFFKGALFARLLPDGRLDLMFGTGGVTSFNTELADRHRTGIAARDDGSIFVATETRDTGAGRDGVIFGLDAAGKPDETFGNNGVVYSMPGASFQSIALQADKVLVSGIYQKGGLIARYTNQGEPDLSYGGFNHGFVLIDGTGGAHVELIHLAQQPDGKTLAAGYIFKGNMGNLLGTLPLLSRVNADGTQDDTFNGGNALEIFVTDESDYGWQALHTTAQLDEKLIVLCQKSSKTALLRYMKDGSPDANFIPPELQLMEYRPSPVIQIQPDAKILVSGSNNGMGAIVRLLG
ncbi:hypothetical protein PSH58_03670 [Pseudomonas hefeiensis]|uniref:Delta-60 repeat domain-containing protein n=1 Tax=Pseudomonas hefeiensis TaxID=2738125 RepID=A0ABY9GD02_9PSED|nr:MULTISPECIES: hypothetical protein [unclassified Pseudomonas]WLH13473.1 hypothetical protein PSH57_03675 [Pseudomonas sp. FP205]WLH96531.1 hypothetical protein PSH58_03670 [Pseudomonas sp. FP53]WLI40808.1 hypothetical protein PSH74_03675 [Pseudomonas sp. FP821]